jgi:hypothetical protein
MSFDHDWLSRIRRLVDGLLPPSEYSRQKTFFLQFADKSIVHIVLGLYILRFRPVLLQNLGRELHTFERGVRLGGKNLAVIAVALFDLVLVFLWIQSEILRYKAQNDRLFRRVLPLGERAA